MFTSTASAAQSFIAQDNPFYVANFTVNTANSTCYGGGKATFAPSAATPASSGGKLAYAVTPRVVTSDCTIQVADQFGNTAVEHVQIGAGGLLMVPAAILFPGVGTQLASNTPPSSFDVAMALNSFLGGGVAQAAGSCSTARAFTNWAGTFGTSTRSGVMRDPQNNPMTDAAGCYLEQPRMVVSEAGFAGTYQLYNDTCGSAITVTGWLPNKYGPTAALLLAAQNPVALCSKQISDGTHAPTTMMAVVPCSSGLILEDNAGCSALTISQPVTNDVTDPVCDPDGGVISGGSTSSVNYSMPSNPYATSTDDGSTFTVTAVAAGSTYYTKTATWSTTGCGKGGRGGGTSTHGHSTTNIGITVWPDLRITSP
ncbi:MAG: hypothetical protein DLM50_00025 [Candidatus Meridianibacter frigidus]|nr:MAG: hypothetical protein DLM50_00025 [Candidatus Eremiobacteraeota bacterium]